MKKQDVITSPKTAKSNRIVVMPEFLCEEMQDYFQMYYSLAPDQRIFPFSKSYLKHEMERGCKATGVPVIRIHDLRHSHVSLLIHMGFTALAIGNRVGHEAEKSRTGMHICFQRCRQRWRINWMWNGWRRMKSDGENVRCKRTMEKPDGGIPGIRGRSEND